jgi:hypothetical protein
VTPRLWRVAGGLALAHVVLTLGGLSLEVTPELGAPVAGNADAFVHSSLSTVLTGGGIEYLGFLVFLGGVLLFAQLLRTDGVTSAWLTSCLTGFAVTYTAVSLAAGFPPGAAALYDGHRGGVPLATLTAINDVRNFAFYLSVGALGVATMALAGSIHLTRRLPHWIATSGYVVGGLCLLAVPLQPFGAVDYATLLWLVWFVALGGAAVRGPRLPAATLRPAVPADV